MTKIRAHICRFSTGNRTEWSTIQGVNVAFGRFEITRPITPELYDTKSCYQLIVSITKCEILSLGIFINVRERFQSIRIKVTGPESFIHFSFPVEAG